MPLLHAGMKMSAVPGHAQFPCRASGHSLLFVLVFSLQKTSRLLALISIRFLVIDVGTSVTVKQSGPRRTFFMPTRCAGYTYRKMPASFVLFLWLDVVGVVAMLALVGWKTSIPVFIRDMRIVHNARCCLRWGAAGLSYFRHPGWRCNLVDCCNVTSVSLAFVVVNEVATYVDVPVSEVTKLVFCVTRHRCGRVNVDCYEGLMPAWS